jgi:glycosyltransferase involved in cell wall biosynthesis
MRIAVVHDYFTQLGGAEKVAEELVRMLPGASLHTTCIVPDLLPPSLAGMPIETSWMQHLPRMKDYYRLYFLLYPLAVRSLDLSEYDLVISSSSGYAKGVRTNRDAIHVCYCHTPMRWAWRFDSYASQETPSPAKNMLMAPMVSALRRWDKGASRFPDHFVANSKTVADRIQRVYGRTAEVIHPPIDVHRFRPCSAQEDYYLVLARLVSYKRIDLAVDACNSLGRRLLIIGDGPDRARLMAKAGPTVEFLNYVSDGEVEHYAARCRALLFPGEEDFGMAPVEVAAAGRPTIAYRAGGAAETIIDGVTGIFFDCQQAEDLAKAIERFERQDWSASVLRRHAEGFDIDVFQARLRSFLQRVGAPIPGDAPPPKPRPPLKPALEPRLTTLPNRVTA